MTRPQEQLQVSILRNISCHRPLRLATICLTLIFVSHTAEARYFGAGSSSSITTTSSGTYGSSYANGGGRGFGSVSLNLRKNAINNDNDNFFDDEEAEPVRPGKNDNDNTQFFETSAQSSLQQALLGEEDEEDFFGVDQTDFPSILPPTESPIPTYEPTVAPSFEQTTAQPTRPEITARPTVAGQGSVGQAPPRTPTVAPTVVLKEVTSPTRAPTLTPGVTARPSLPPDLSTNLPTQLETISSTPVFTWNPTADPLAPNNNTLETEVEVGAEEAPTESPTNMPSLIQETGNSTNTTVTNMTETDAPTQAPTADVEAEVAVTDTPTDSPTTAQPTSFSPTDTPTTLVPTLVRTTAPRGEFPVAGQLSLRLQGVADGFSADTRLVFLATADEFIAEAATGMVEDIRVMLIYQSLVDLDAPSNDGDWSGRRLADDSVLQVDLGVEGLAHEETFSASEWNAWLEDLFTKNSIEFVDMLQEMGDAENTAFFMPLEEVKVVEREPVVLPTPTSPAPTSGTGTTTSAAPPPYNLATIAPLESDQGVPIVAIVGAAVGGFVFLIVGIMLVRYVIKVEGRKRSASSHNSNSNSLADNFGPTPPTNPDGDAGRNSISNNSNSLNITSIQPKPSMGGSSISSESYLTNSANHHMNFTSAATMSSSNHPTAPPYSESDNASQMGGMTVSSQVDNASYAYSLEPGIEPSLAGVPQSVAASGMSFSAYPGGSSVASMTSGTSSFAFLKLPISKSGSGGAGGSNLAGKPTKDVIAPPGKLGIVIDTTLDGPVVHKVNAGSALEGKLKSGDIIVAIDDVDTRAMTAASITALMVKTANQRRKLTIVSP